MGYEIYFDESNKLDQPNGGYSYYGALGISEEKSEEIVAYLEGIIDQNSELHFAEYNNDNNFGKYFKCLNYIAQQEIYINIFIVNNEDATTMGRQMSVSVKELRSLFYVKIPERLFYGMTRNLDNGEQVNIFVDNNQEYDTLGVYKKLEEQMNAHSAYRKKGYKVNSVKPLESEESLCLQIIDVFMGIVVFLIENQFTNVGKREDTVLKVKSDLIYRFLTQGENIKNLQGKINLYKWDVNDVGEISKVNFGDYLSEFLVAKTQFDLIQMTRLERIRSANPNQTTKFYRQEMGYSNRELRTIQGYIDQLDGKGRNSFFLK